MLLDVTPRSRRMTASGRLLVGLVTFTLMAGAFHHLLAIPTPGVAARDDDIHWVLGAVLGGVVAAATVGCADFVRQQKPATGWLDWCLRPSSIVWGTPMLGGFAYLTGQIHCRMLHLFTRGGSRLAAENLHASNWLVAMAVSGLLVAAAVYMVYPLMRRLNALTSQLYFAPWGKSNRSMAARLGI